jgi:hypothetical protein
VNQSVSSLNQGVSPVNQSVSSLNQSVSSVNQGVSPVNQSVSSMNPGHQEFFPMLFAYPLLFYASSLLSFSRVSRVAFVFNFPFPNHWELYCFLGGKII